MWDAASHRSSRLKRLCNKQSALLVPHPNRPEAESRMGASDDPNLLTNKEDIPILLMPALPLKKCVAVKTKKEKTIKRQDECVRGLIIL